MGAGSFVLMHLTVKVDQDGFAVGIRGSGCNSVLYALAIGRAEDGNGDRNDSDQFYDFTKHNSPQAKIIDCTWKIW